MEIFVETIIIFQTFQTDIAVFLLIGHFRKKYNFPFQLQLPSILWLLYFANLLWTVAYDTYYALVDRPDDLKVGIKSTAILFGRFALPIIALLQLACLVLLLLVGVLAELHPVFYLSLALSAGCFVYQHRIARRSREGCFAAFLHNHYVGMLVFAGIALSYLLKG